MLSLVSLLCVNIRSDFFPDRYGSRTTPRISVAALNDLLAEFQRGTALHTNQNPASGTGSKASALTVAQSKINGPLSCVGISSAMSQLERTGNISPRQSTNRIARASVIYASVDAVGASEDVQRGPSSR